MRIGHLNVWGWTNTNHDLRVEIIKYSDCDIVSINETHLLNKDNLDLDGYQWIGLNRSNVHVKAPNVTNTCKMVKNWNLFRILYAFVMQ